jgi:hypothetical protein
MRENDRYGNDRSRFHCISLYHISLHYLVSSTTVFLSFPSCTKLQTDESNISVTALVATTIRILFLDYTTKQVLTILPLKAGQEDKIYTKNLKLFSLLSKLSWPWLLLMKVQLRLEAKNELTALCKYDKLFPKIISYHCYMLRSSAPKFIHWSLFWTYRQL